MGDQKKASTERTDRAPRERRLPTALVLAIASGMICVGVLGVLASEPQQTDTDPQESRVDVSDTTAEAAAESFLDAWRKREHDVAASLSVEDAHQAVLQRARRDDALSPSERDMQRQVWDAMASTRLSLVLNESEELGGGRLRLSGTAEGEFLESPYAREIDFELVPRGDHWRVAQVEFGTILTDAPDALRFEL